MQPEQPNKKHKLSEEKMGQRKRAAREPGSTPSPPPPLDFFSRGEAALYSGLTPPIPEVQAPKGEAVANLLAAVLPQSVSAETTFAQRLENKVLLLDAPPRSRRAKEAEQPKGKQKGRVHKKMSRREMRFRGFLTVDDHAGIQYQDCLPLHELWLGYIAELLGPTASSTAIAGKITHADLHGAMLTVARSRDPHNIGVTGILIRETENTFSVVTEDNHVKLIPKAQSEFSFMLPRPEGPFWVTLHGQNLCSRPADRATKKIKCSSSLAL
ncbi:putative ribonuclease P subunit P29 [Paratrimastix pyriformis]|uniref:Ribonuclease P subunit P29 n=1 Tax=Paratrimastix pyriformis TaxID=342808 RepID=A0ABQ8UUP2_9EUKA|nr:putative ribonuclease P subunit P29 [Paratrimastix pyriformis]